MAIDGIELTKEEREHAVTRLRAYFERERDEEIGDLAARLMLDFISEQIAPFYYNRGIRDAQSIAGRAAMRLDEDIDAAQRMPPGWNPPRSTEAPARAALED